MQGWSCTALMLVVEYKYSTLTFIGPWKKTTNAQRVFCVDISALKSDYCVKSCAPGLFSTKLWFQYNRGFNSPTGGHQLAESVWIGIAIFRGMAVNVGELCTMFLICCCLPQCDLNSDIQTEWHSLGRQSKELRSLQCQTEISLNTNNKHVWM